MKLPRCMPIDMAIQARDAEAGMGSFTVIGRIEFFLRQWGQQHLQTVQLHRRQNILE